MTTKDEFVTRFGGIFEHSPWVAERAWLKGFRGPLTAAHVHAAMVSAFAEAPAEERLAVLKAHPDLAGRLAVADELTAASKAEQASAGLDRLTPEEHARFSELNRAYVARFGFPFIMAVKGKTRQDIVAAFEERIQNSQPQEFATACAEVERIVILRLDAMLPAAAARILTIEPLTKEAFAAFGAVIETEGAERRLINGGTTERFHALAASDVGAEGGRAILSVFRAQPRTFPYAVAMMERHPLGSQAFYPLDDRPWLVVVAEDDCGTPAPPRAFRAAGRQGVQYGRNVWHHPLIAVAEVGDFIVADREGPGDNLEEVAYDEPYILDAPWLTR